MWLNALDSFIANTPQNGVTFNTFTKVFAKVNESNILVSPIGQNCFVIAHIKVHQAQSS